MAAVQTAAAQDKTLYVAAYGGSYEQTMRKDIIPAFEKATGVKVEYVAGNSTDNLAKLQAQKGNQQIDVVILDDGPMYQAVSLNFCADLQKAQLAKANLHETELYLSDLRGADLSQAQNLAQDQLQETCGDQSTKLPAGLKPPPNWPCASRQADE